MEYISGKHKKRGGVVVSSSMLSLVALGNIRESNGKLEEIKSEKRGNWNCAEAMTNNNNTCTCNIDQFTLKMSYKDLVLKICGTSGKIFLLGLPPILFHNDMCKVNERNFGSSSSRHNWSGSYCLWWKGAKEQQVSNESVAAPLPLVH